MPRRLPSNREFAETLVADCSPAVPSGDGRNRSIDAKFAIHGLTSRLPVDGFEEPNEIGTEDKGAVAESMNTEPRASSSAKEMAADSQASLEIG